MSDEATGATETPETIEEWMRRSCCRFCGSRRFRVQGLVRAMQDYIAADDDWGACYNIDCDTNMTEAVECLVCDKELWTEGNQVPEVVTERDTYQLWVRALPDPGGEPGAGPWVKVSDDRRADALLPDRATRLIVVATTLWELGAPGVKVSAPGGVVLFCLDSSVDQRS